MITFLVKSWNYVWELFIASCVSLLLLFRKSIMSPSIAPWLPSVFRFRFVPFFQRNQQKNKWRVKMSLIYLYMCVHIRSGYDFLKKKKKERIYTYLIKKLRYKILYFDWYIIWHDIQNYRLSYIKQLFVGLFQYYLMICMRIMYVCNINWS